MKRFSSLLLPWLLSLTAWAQTGQLYRYDTVADLVAAKIYNYSRGAIVDGYTTKGDGGGGVFMPVNNITSTNIGTKLASVGTAGSSWARQFSGAVNVQWFGMVGGDGVGENLLTLPDSRMSTATYSGSINWGLGLTTHTLQSAMISGGKLVIELKAVPSGSQNISVAGTRLRYPNMSGTGRYVLRLKARLTGGSAVQLFLGKSQGDANAQMVFTPTGTETTYSGWLDSDGVGSSLYLGLKNNADANGSTYTVDDVEIYFVGPATLTSVPDYTAASDEAIKWTAALEEARRGPTRLIFPKNRIFRFDGGSFWVPDGTDIDLQGSTLYLSGLSSEPGLHFARNGSIRNGKVISGVTSAGADQGLIQVGNAQNEQAQMGWFSAENLTIQHDLSGKNFGLLVFGAINTVVRNVDFADTSLTRRLIGIVWSGALTPQYIGTHPAVNVSIQNVYAGQSLQNFPTEGGGAVVSVNGMVNCSISGVYADTVGRSLITIGPGDYGDTMFQKNWLNAGLLSASVRDCAVSSQSIGYRVSGSSYLGAADYMPVNVVFDNCHSYGITNSSTMDAGFRIEGSVAEVTIRNSHVVGHQNGVLLTNVFGDGSGSSVRSAHLLVDGNTIIYSKANGISLSGARSSHVTRNRILDSGTALGAGGRSAIRLLDQNVAVVVRDNIIGRTGESGTSQNAGIEVDSDADNQEIVVVGNLILGAAQGGTPVNYGALATFAQKGPNYTGYGTTYDNDNTGDGQFNAFLVAKDLGSPIAGMTVGSTLVAAPSTLTLTDNQARFVAVWVPQKKTITGVKFINSTAGVYTADQNNEVGLYTLAGTTLTRVAVSANDGNIWKAAADAVVAVPFQTPYAANPGTYYVGLVFNTSAPTTVPVLKTLAGMAGGLNTLDLTASLMFSGTLASANALPASQAFSGINSSTALPWLILY